MRGLQIQIKLCKLTPELTLGTQTLYLRPKSLTTIALALLSDAVLPMQRWAEALAVPLRREHRSGPRVALHWLKQRGVIHRRRDMLELRYGVRLDIRAILNADYDQALDAIQWYGSGLPPPLLESPNLSQAGRIALQDLQQRLVVHVQRLRGVMGRLTDAQRTLLKAICDLTNQNIQHELYQEVIPLAQAGATLARRYGAQNWEGTFLQHEGSARTQLGDLAGASRCYEQAIVVLTAAGDTERLAWATHGLARVLLEAGHVERAQENLQALWRQHLSPFLREHVGIDLALVQYRAGDPAGAVRTLQGVLAQQADAAETPLRFWVWLNLAWAALAAERPKLAKRAYEAAGGLIDGVPQPDAQVRLQVLRAVLQLHGILQDKKGTGWAVLRHALTLAGRQSVALQRELESYVAQVGP